MSDRDVFQLPSVSSSSDDSLGEKLSREAQLLKGAPQHIWGGVQERFNEIKNDPVKGGLLIAEGAAIGFGIALLTRNPSALFGAGKLLAAHPAAFAAAGIGLDATIRTAPAMIDTWNNPNNLEANQMRLGHSWGAAAIDYPLMGAGGWAGVKLPETGIAKGLSSISLRPLSEALFAPRPALAFTDGTAGGGATLRASMLSDAAATRAVTTEGRMIPGEAAGDGGGGFRRAVDIIAERGHTYQRRTLEESPLRDLEGRYLGQGDEFIAIETRDGRVIKVGRPKFEDPTAGRRPFDAKLYGKYEGPEGTILVQEKLRPIDHTDVEYDQFRAAFDHGPWGKKWQFVDPKPDNIGLDANGRPKLLDYGAVLDREQLPNGRKLIDDLDLERRANMTAADEPEVIKTKDSTPIRGNQRAEDLLAPVMKNGNANGEWVTRGWRGVKDLPEVKALLEQGIKQRQIEKAMTQVWGEPI